MEIERWEVANEPLPDNFSPFKCWRCGKWHVTLYLARGYYANGKMAELSYVCPDCRDVLRMENLL